MFDINFEKALRIVNDIQCSIKYESLISIETEKWLIHWLSNEEKTSTDREILQYLAESNILPWDNGCLFRGCKTIRNGQAQSYSLSIREAAKFAGENGIIIAVDTTKHWFQSFDLQRYLAMLLDGIIMDNDENPYSERLIDAYETTSGEDELFLITDIDYSTILQVREFGVCM